MRQAVTLRLCGWGSLSVPSRIVFPIYRILLGTRNRLALTLGSSFVVSLALLVRREHFWNNTAGYLHIPAACIIL